MFALNVARDDIAAGELLAMGRELTHLHTLDPLGVVDVLDIAPDVLACAWVEGRELHVVDRGDGRGLFIAVEESASATTGRQLMLTGREGVPASDTIWASWLEALVRQTTVDERGRYYRPRVEANEGDLVLVNEQPVLVALSPARSCATVPAGSTTCWTCAPASATRCCAGATAPAHTRRSSGRSRPSRVRACIPRRRAAGARRARNRAGPGSAPRAPAGAAGCTCTPPARARP